MDYISVIKPQLLDRDFLSQYESRKPPFRSDLGLVVYLRTYSRYVPQLKRRERWWETVLRVVEYSMSLYQGPASRESLVQEAKDLYDTMFNMEVFTAGRTMWVGGTDVVKRHGSANFNCSFRVIDSIEAYPEIFYLLLVGAGTGFSVEKKYIDQLSTFNTNIRLEHRPYTGLPRQLRQEYTQVEIGPDWSGLFAPMAPDSHVLDQAFLIDDQTTLISDAINRTQGKVKVLIKVGDSKEGWCNALKAYLYAAINPKTAAIEFNYNSVRPAGERLLTMGGRASGPDPLKRMFEKIHWIINRCAGRLTSVAAMDISNCIAEGVVVGGVRRSSQIALGDADDLEFIDAKYGLWVSGLVNEEQLEDLLNLLSKAGLVIDPYQLRADTEKEKVEKPWLVGTPLDLIFKQVKGGNHVVLWEGRPEYQAAADYIDAVDSKYRYRASRVMSNNSVHLWVHPGREGLETIFQRIRDNGEPGIYIAANAALRRPNYAGTNPCGEILLANQAVCNLTEHNLLAFVNGPDDFDYARYERAVRLATRAGSRMTNVAMWHPKWDAIQKRDRLLGVSATGQVEAWDALGWGYEIVDGQYTYKADERIERVLELGKLIARQEAESYHEEMGIPQPLLVTTVKPSGSISQLPTVSSGIHRPYAPYYQRRVRSSAADPISKALRELGVPVVPENNQGYDLDAPECNTWVFSFMVKTAAPVRAIDESAIAQLERYKQSMLFYTEHNVSFTCTVAWNEWDSVIDWLDKPENWAAVVGVSFLNRWDPTEGDSPYPNLPYEPSTREAYEVYIEKHHLDESRLIELIAQYETEYEEFEPTDQTCETGACPIR